MASWKRWPLSWAFRVSRQVLTMKRRREELEEAPEPENGGLSREHAAWWELERVWHKQSTKSESGNAESSGWRGQGPKLSHPHSYCLSLLPIANVHKCWLFFSHLPGVCAKHFTTVMSVETTNSLMKKIQLFCPFYRHGNWARMSDDRHFPSHRTRRHPQGQQTVPTVLTTP